MYIQSNKRYLQLMAHTINNVLAPKLLDDDSKAVVAILDGAIKELYKREDHTCGLLRRTNKAGLALIEDLQQFLTTKVDAVRESSLITAYLGIAEKEDSQQSPLPMGFDNLRIVNNEINAIIARLMAELANTREERQQNAQELDRLMRAGADWDYAYTLAQRETMEFPAYDLAQVPSGEDINLGNLQAFIDKEYPDECVQVSGLEKIPGGMGKHTYGGTLAWEDGSTEDIIVRKEDTQPVFSRGACKIAAEYDLLTAVAKNGVKVPTPLHLAHDEKAFNSDFFTMTRSPGVVPGNFFGATMELSEELLLDVAANLAQLHRIDIDAFADYFAQHVSPDIVGGDIRNAYRIEIEYWKEEYTRNKPIPNSPANTYAWDWLLDNIPNNRERPVLVHGDFNLHNILVKDNRLIAVLDWELAIAGDPAQDIAYIKPNIEKYIDWDNFMQAYYDNGGRKIDSSTFDYYTAFANARPLVASLHNMHLFDKGKSNDVRFPYIDTEFVPQFTGNILNHSAQSMV